VFLKVKKNIFKVFEKTFGW